MILPLLAGTAVIASPPQIGLPIAAAMAAVKTFQAVQQSRSRKKCSNRCIIGTKRTWQSAPTWLVFLHTWALLRCEDLVCDCDE